MKLMYGPARIAKIITDCTIFNFSSLLEGYQNSNLIPPNNLGATTEYDFDVKYMEFILNNDINFYNFLTIVMEIYYGKDVFLIVSEEDWSINIVESLLKLIQQRYGINGYMISQEDDLYDIPESQFNPYYGITNFDNDKLRWINIYEYNRISNGGKVPDEFEV